MRNQHCQQMILPCTRMILATCHNASNSISSCSVVCMCKCKLGKRMDGGCLVQCTAGSGATGPPHPLSGVRGHLQRRERLLLDAQAKQRIRGSEL